MRKLATLACVSILLVGCQSSSVYSGDVYTADQAKQVQYVSYGTVVAVRAVKIQTNTTSNGSTSSFIGSIGGAILGGFLGNTIGGGSGHDLAVAAGAIGGALVGGAVQDQVSEVNAVQLTIRQENGSTIVLVQKSPANMFHEGQQVSLVSNGKQINVAPK